MYAILDNFNVVAEIEYRDVPLSELVHPDYAYLYVSIDEPVDVKTGDVYHKDSGIFESIETPTPEPIPIPETPEQQHVRYEAITAQYIHERYAIDKEQAITRKAIAYPADEALQAEFVAYNAYAEDCKARARVEVFGA